eukprot:5970353-Amphidinium_carterae.1
MHDQCQHVQDYATNQNLCVLEHFVSSTEPFSEVCWQSAGTAPTLIKDIHDVDENDANGNLAVGVFGIGMALLAQLPM